MRGLLAMHSFTVPEAGEDPSAGAAHNPQAGERSWRAMQQFFSEILSVH